MKKILNKKLEALSTFAICIFTLPTLLPLLHKGFFLSDDGEWMVIRLTAFFEALRHGQFPVRYLLRLNNEFGYPLSNFAYPGFLYIGSIIHLFRFGFIDSIKIIIFLSLFLGSIFTFLFLKKRFKTLPAIVGSIIYLYTPYHLFDLYRRGSVGELLSISIIPFLFWQIERKNNTLLALGIFGLILSHNIIAFISLPFVFLYTVLVNWKNIGDKKKWFDIFWPYFVGVLLSAFFFIPAVYDLRYIVFSGLKIADWHAFFADISILGISSILILVISIFIILKKDKDQRAIFFVIVSLFSIFMGTKISTPVWNVIPASFILFPFRFLSILPIGLSFLAAFFVSKFKNNLKIIFAVLLVTICFYSTSAFLTPIRYLDREDNYYLNNFATTTADNEYMPKWVKVTPMDIPSKRIEVSKGNAVIDSDLLNSEKITFASNSSDAAIIKVNAIYFPGWKAFIDGVSTVINYQNPNGAMEINVPSGSHVITLKYEETGAHLISDLISLIGFILLGILFIRDWKYGSKNN